MQDTVGDLHFVVDLALAYLLKLLLLLLLATPPVPLQTEEPLTLGHNAGQAVASAVGAEAKLCPAIWKFNLYSKQIYVYLCFHYAWQPYRACGIFWLRLSSTECDPAPTL